MTAMPSMTMLARTAAATARAQAEQGDQARGAFLLWLDGFAPVTLPEAEAQLVARFMAQPKNSVMRFSPKQRAAIDRMIAGYGRPA